MMPPGFKHSEESKQKMRLKALASFANGRKHPWEGEKLPEKWCENISNGTKGRKPSMSMLGKKLSDEAKKKIREARAKQVFTPERNEKLSKAFKELYKSGKMKCTLPKKPWNYGKEFLALRGEKHHKWKGGVTPENMKIRMSIEMKNWRRAVFERDDYTCQFCKKRGGDLNADHIELFSERPELRFEISNGRTLCEECHRSRHAKSKV